MKVLIKMICIGSLFASVLMTSMVHATWTSYTYTNSDGKAVYGVQNGRTEKIPLNTTKKKADRAAKKLNKTTSKVMVDPNGEGDLKQGEIPGFPNI